MINFEAMLRRALTALGGDGVAIATPYELPDRICRDLIAEGLANSMVVDSQTAAQTDANCAGWWVDRSNGLLQLRYGKVTSLLIAGVDPSRRIHPTLLLEARLKGVQRIVTTDASGETIEDVEVTSALLQALARLHPDRHVSDISYDDAFETLYQLMGDRLALPRGSFFNTRVALCIGSLGPGGAERQCAYTAVGTRQHGFDASVICNHLDTPGNFFRPHVENKGVHVVQVPVAPEELNDPEIQRIHTELDQKYSSLGFGNIFIEIVRCASALRSLKPAIVHNWMDYLNVISGTAAQLVGIPGLILSGRSLGPSHFRIFQPYMRPGYQALLRRRHAIMLNNSHAGAGDYAAWLGIDSSQIRVIHNGFEFPETPTPDVRYRIRNQYSISESTRVVGSILRFAEEKQPHLLIDMAAEIHAKDNSIRFLFFGGGILLEAMRCYVTQLHLSHAVQLPGLTDASWDALSAMDLFVLTSRMEGLPNVLVEAQASGLPVICTGVGGMNETFIEGETGLSVPQATAPALAEAALALLNNPVRLEKMSARAAQHARKKFGLKRMINATIRIYDDALGHPPQRIQTIKNSRSNSNYGAAAKWVEVGTSSGLSA